MRAHPTFALVQVSGLVTITKAANNSTVVGKTLESDLFMGTSLKTMSHFFFFCETTRNRVLRDLGLLSMASAIFGLLTGDLCSMY